MDKPSYLTKSRFKLGLECPVKLFYTGKKQYQDQKKDDEFMEALAEGGFQVGELAKLKYRGGHDIETLDYDESIAITNEELSKDKTTIYEAAIKHEDLFIRVDILKKTNDFIEIIEVKAKSYDQPDLEKDPFLDGRSKKVKKIAGKWKPYLNDIAFQYYVATKAFPGMTIIPKLLLVDNSKQTVTDGLNQRFKITKEGDRKKVIVCNELTNEDLENDLLKEINVQEYIDTILATDIDYGGRVRSFEEHVEFLSQLYKEDIKADIHISSNCKNCEFRIDIDETNFKSGFRECWSQACGWSDEDFREQNLFDIWDNRNIEKFLEDRKLKLCDFYEDDFLPKTASKSTKPGLARHQRQWLQVQKAQDNDLTPYFDKQGLAQEMQSWKFPLHFIDFETAMVAIPFNAGKYPYEQIAFQFSHHKVYENGQVEHASQFINDKVGEFPNFEFIMALEQQLNQDDGTIFRYSNHENTVLLQILEQIENSQDELDDREELKQFILSITSHSKSNRVGERSMVDLWDLVKRFYYHPEMKGSNSIKYVLPAVLNSSDYLKDKYSKPIYGAEGGIQSLNFHGQNKAWVEFDDQGRVKDPYKNLPPLFEDLSQDDLEAMERYSDSEHIANGAAAMTAYARMQFTRMSDDERAKLRDGLLRYCELDTLAMVMIYEAWREASSPL